MLAYAVVSTFQTRALSSKIIATFGGQIRRFFTRGVSRRGVCTRSRIVPRFRCVPATTLLAVLRLLFVRLSRLRVHEQFSRRLLIDLIDQAGWRLNRLIFGCIGVPLIVDIVSVVVRRSVPPIGVVIPRETREEEPITY